MICRGCVKQHAFLAHYTGLAVTNVEKEGESKDETPEVGDDKEANPDVETPDSGAGNFSKQECFSGLVNLHVCPPGQDDPSPKPFVCPLTLPAQAPRSLFLPIGWRNQVSLYRVTSLKSKSQLVSSSPSTLSCAGV